MLRNTKFYFMISLIADRAIKNGTKADMRPACVVAGRAVLS
jgi:hypothetical protein